MFSGSTTDNQPLLMTSDDGGEIWTDQDVSSSLVYDGTELIGTGGPFIEDNYIRYSWNTTICHNGWKSADGYIEKCQSLDMDCLTLFNVTTDNSSLSSYCGIAKRLPKGYDFDILAKKLHTKSYLNDIVNKDTVYKSLLIGNLLRDSFEITLISITPDILNQTSLTKSSYYDICLFDTPEKTYSADIRLIDDHMEEITVSVERYTPQLLDIEYLDLPYKPYDSRTQKVVP